MLDDIETQKTKSARNSTKTFSKGGPATAEPPRLWSYIFGVFPGDGSLPYLWEDDDEFWEQDAIVQDDGYISAGNITKTFSKSGPVSTAETFYIFGEYANDGSLPFPWEDVDESWAKDAIVQGDGYILARYLRESNDINPRIIRALIEMLSPTSNHRWKLHLRKRSGRKKSLAKSKPITIASLARRISKTITTMKIDAKLCRELADMIDPSSDHAFYLKFQQRGKPPGSPYWASGVPTNDDVELVDKYIDDAIAELVDAVMGKEVPRGPYGKRICEAAWKVTYACKTLNAFDDYRQSVNKKTGDAISELVNAVMGEEVPRVPYGKLIYKAAWGVAHACQNLNAVCHCRMTDWDEVQAECERRRQIGLTIDPATAVTRWWDADFADPYGILDEKFHLGIVDEQFARNRGASNADWVNFSDLPEATKKALQERLSKANTNQ
jgi:hypothetical protein